VDADFKTDFASFKYFQKGPQDDNLTTVKSEIAEGRAGRRQATAGGVNHSINVVSRDFGLAAAIDGNAQ